MQANRTKIKLESWVWNENKLVFRHVEGKVTCIQADRRYNKLSNSSLFHHDNVTHSLCNAIHSIFTVFSLYS
jgi:hypothetical protein